MNLDETIAAVERAWASQEFALTTAGLETARLPRLEVGHQSFVTGFLTALMTVGAIAPEDFPTAAMIVFARRDEELAERN